jgi:hypothetical protein
MKRMLFCDRQNLATIEKTFSRNAGIEHVLERPQVFSYEGGPLEFVDTAEMSEDNCRTAYRKCAMWPAAVHHYEVKPIFGTGNYGGIFFGRKVPALVIESDSGEVLDVFPHRKAGREVTIREVLTKS